MSKKEKIISWIKANPHCWVLSYFIVYVLWFFGLEFFSEPVVWIYSPLDDLIPFCEYFIVPYFLWFPYFLGSLAYFMFKDRKLFLKLCFVMFTGMTVCLTVYTIAPNAIDLRQEIVGNNIFCKFAELLRTVDTSTNVCPSIHVASTVAVHWAICRYKAFKRPFITKSLSLILAAAICLSTLFLKQHSVIDLVWGLVLTATLVLILKVAEMLYPVLKIKGSCDKL